MAAKWELGFRQEKLRAASLFRSMFWDHDVLFHSVTYLQVDSSPTGKQRGQPHACFLHRPLCLSFPKEDATLGSQMCWLLPHITSPPRIPPFPPSHAWALLVRQRSREVGSEKKEYNKGC